MSRRSLALVVVAGLIGIEGLLAARVGFAPFAFQSAVLMLAGGWVTAGAGLVAWNLAPTSRIGPLLAVAGATAFMGAFQHAGSPADVVAMRLGALHLAVLGHAVLAHPDGRVRSRPAAALVGSGYVVALLAVPDGTSMMAVWLACAVVLRRAVVGRDPRRGTADLAGFVAAAGLAGGTLIALIPDIPLNGAALVYAGPAAAAVLLAADVLNRTPARSRVTDAVLRVDSTAPTNVIAELRRATGDPTLGVGVRASDGAGYVDLAGRPLVLPTPGSGWVATPIAWGDGQGAVVIHDGRLDTTAALSAASGRAIELASANARLQGELRAQVADVRASRRRIVEAGAAARSALEHRLAAGLLPGCDRLERCLGRRDGDREGGDGAATAGVLRALSEIRVELGRLADGLDPSALDAGGLSGALERLVGRSSVPVRLTGASLPPLQAVTSATAWFVCNEALANIAKHAVASHAWIAATVTDERLTIEVVDDGVGGADPEGGTGLRGLRDRVEALGGTLRLESALGSGTRLRAELPLGAM